MSKPRGKVWKGTKRQRYNRLYTLKRYRKFATLDSIVLLFPTLNPNLKSSLDLTQSYFIHRSNKRIKAE